MTREEIINEIRCLLSELDNGEDAVSYLTQNDVKWLNENIKALEQEPCEDEYIKIPKKALKYVTKGMVAYNYEWLKNHFDIERAIICGVQEPKIGHWIMDSDKEHGYCDQCGYKTDLVNGDYHNFCRKCGTRMVEPKESKNKEITSSDTKTE